MVRVGSGERERVRFLSGIKRKYLGWLVFSLKNILSFCMYSLLINSYFSICALISTFTFIFIFCFYFVPIFLSLFFTFNAYFFVDNCTEIFSLMFFTLSFFNLYIFYFDFQFGFSFIPLHNCFHFLMFSSFTFHFCFTYLFINDKVLLFVFYSVIIT